MVKESLRYIAAPLLFPCDVLRRAAHARRCLHRKGLQRPGSAGFSSSALSRSAIGSQIRRGERVHRLHNLATMNADSYFADAKLAAICLLTRPFCKQSHDFPSRSVRRANRSWICARARPCAASARWRSIPWRTASSSSCSRKGFDRNSIAPAFMARTEIAISPWPVMKTIGVST